MRKKFLFILRQTPFGRKNVPEMLDLMMTVAAFDQPVSVLFLDDGVLLLKRGQTPSGIGLQSSEVLFKALALYDIRDLWVETESLDERGIAREHLSVATRPVARGEVADLLERFDVTWQA